MVGAVISRASKVFELTAFRLLASVRPPGHFCAPPAVRSIVVLACTGIGSGLFCSAAIESLARGYPGSRLMVVAHRKRMAVARHNPYVDEVLPYSKSPFARLRLLQALRSAHPDLIVALRLNEDTVPLGYLANRRAFVGSKRRCKAMSFLLSMPIDPPRNIHSVDEMLFIARAAGGSNETCSMVYRVTPDEDAALARKFQDVIDKPFIVWQVAATESEDPRVWPAALATRAVENLRRAARHRIVLTGGPEETRVAGQMAAACPGVINVCGLTSFEETAALVRRADLVVSRDTGVMHLGVALGTPTLALFHSAERVGLYGPPTTGGRHCALWPESAGASDSKRPMTRLSPDMVTDHVLKMIGSQGRRSVALGEL
jgi:ADP-heptose:LPS heptosyltransferase